MSKNNYTNHSNHLENHDSDNFSNSRLHAHTVCISDPKLSFDAMTVESNTNILKILAIFIITF